MVGSTVGYEAEEEKPEYFKDNFQMKTEIAKKQLDKRSRKNTAIKNERNEGHSIEKEAIQDLKIPELKPDKTSMSATTTIAVEKATMNPRSD